MKNFKSFMLTIVGVFVAILCTAAIPSYSHNDVMGTPTVSELSTINGSRSYSDCWDFYYIPQSHTFNCGSCGWYSVTAEHDHFSPISIEIQERASDNQLLDSYSSTIPAGGTFQYTNSNPSPGTAKIVVKVGNVPYVVFGTVCVSTLGYLAQKLHCIYIQRSFFM